MPSDSFSLSIRVGCENKRVAVFERGDNVIKVLFADRTELPSHGKIIVWVYRAVFARQIADMPVTCQNFIVWT